MSKRGHYPAGVPCWVDTIQPDLEAATHFYGGLMGWTLEGGLPVDGHWSHYVARVHDDEVAGIAPLPPLVPDVPASWVTQVRVDSIVDSVKIAESAGATVVLEFFDAAPAGRMAVLEDPGGAVISLWEPLSRQGAVRVNEAGAWAMSSLSSADTHAAAGFYREAFGWVTETTSVGDAEVTLFRLPGYIGGEPRQPVSREVVAVMVPTTEDGVDTDTWTVDFWVDDLDRTIALAELLQGSVLRPATEAPAGGSAVLADPAGAPFSVTQAPTAPTIR